MSKHDLQALIHKAETLHEALPYIRKFHGRTFVIKYGGHAMTDPELQKSFAKDITLLKYVGLNPIVVHGGGPQIDEHLQKLGVKTDRVEGIRITDAETVDVVEMVLAGKVNQAIVSMICSAGGRAVGLSGKDDGFIRARAMGAMKTVSGNVVDPGRVGKIETVNTELMQRLVTSDFIPVIAPIAVDETGASLNVNADTVAGAIAASMQAEKLILMTDISGVKNKEGELANSLTLSTIKQWIKDGVIQGGMIPKVQCALDALEMGVSKCHILDGRLKHAVLLELFTDEGVGTEICLHD